jgi:putative transposase
MPTPSVEQEFRRLREENRQLKMERDILKRAAEWKFAFVHDHRDTWPVTVVCRVLEVTAAGYYASRKRPVSDRAKRHATLVEQIRAEFIASRDVCGSPRLTRMLNARGVRRTENTVAKVLKSPGLSAVPPRRVRPTPSQAVAAAEPLNVLNRDFEAARPDTKWTTDITSLWTVAGWVFLAVVIDLYSRRVVGCALSRNPDAELVSRAFRHAVTRRRPGSGLLVHSDRGCQYLSAAYQQLVSSSQAVVSSSRTGNCWDNAPTGSYFASLKKELWYRWSFADEQDAERGVFESIEVFDDRERLHSSLGYVSPATA